MSSLTLTRTISANVSRRSSVASIMAYGEETQHYNSRRASVNAAQPEQPPKPNPAIDSGVIPRIESPASTPYFPNDPDHDDFDVATLKPMAALNMLSKSVQGLMDYTGNSPPTPPVSIPSSPLPAHMRENVIQSPSRPATPPSAVSSHDIRAPGFKKVEIGSPETTYAEPSHVGAGAQTIRAQREAVARKFFSKQPPPICIHEYLLRLHRYLPMSTGVYLAAGVYIHKLAVVDRAVPVTPRTAHRLLLASLRIAMKALEDLSYPHARFAGVGGVSEKELAKLEISLCFLMDFNLRVDNAGMYHKNSALLRLVGDFGRVPELSLNVPERPRRAIEAAS